MQNASTNNGHQISRKTDHSFTRYACLKFQLVVGSIEENRYRHSVDTSAKVSILTYHSKSPYHELYMYKLVTYFDFWTSNFLGSFDICPFLVISILDYYYIFFLHFWRLFQWQSIVSILFRTTSFNATLCENLFCEGRHLLLRRVININGL